MNIQAAISAATDKIVSDYAPVAAALDAAKAIGVDLRTIGLMRRAAVTNLLDNGMADAGFDGNVIDAAMNDAGVVHNLLRFLMEGGEDLRGQVGALIVHCVEAA
jgi:hypothetical protein